MSAAAVPDLPEPDEPPEPIRGRLGHALDLHQRPDTYDAGYADARKELGVPAIAAELQAHCAALANLDRIESMPPGQLEAIIAIASAVLADHRSTHTPRPAEAGGASVMQLARAEGGASARRGSRPSRPRPPAAGARTGPA